MKRIFPVLSVVTAAAALMFPQTGKADKKAREIIDRVQKTVKELKTLTCSFEQEYVWKETGKIRTIAGILEVKEPYKLRVEYPAQTIVVDGKTVWWYIPKNNQVTIQNFEEGDEMFPTPYGIFRKYIARKDAPGKAVIEGTEKIDNRPCLKLHLGAGPEDDSDVTVWIDTEHNFPVKSVEKLANGDVNTYLLKDVNLDKPINDTVFTFAVPEGVDVVDMRQ